ncbi:MAG: alpha-1,2-fucosyltransferase [Candidatus Adlerbacteria bacterium]
MEKTKPVIIPKIIGGLGNQMFQYAFARMLSLKTDADLKLDILDFKTYEFHTYSLSHFNIQEIYATERDVAPFKRHKRQRGIRGKLLNPFFYNPRRYVAEDISTFSQKMTELTPPCYLDGYWLSEKYFLPIKDIIRKEFALKTPLSDYSKDIAKKILDSPESISFHIRRGDFVKHASVSKHHGICPPEYYDEAIRILNERFPQGEYFVFSDDIEWARENLVTGRPTTFIGQGPDKNYEDLGLMSLCKHHVLSNSTFGWWGAWLSEETHTGTTIAPKKWLAKPFDTSDLIPERWITLPY